MTIPLYRPFVSNEVKTKMLDILDSRWFGYGKMSMYLEQKLVDAWGGFSLATNSCTSALYLVAETIKKTDTDEVIIPAITFVSTGMAFLNAGYKVVVADVDKNGIMNIEAVKKLITDKTRAIVPVHLYGQKVDLCNYRKLCDEKEIYLVEDCAHRIGYYDTIRYGDFACFSFNTMKELPSGEGGAVWGKELCYEKKLREVANVGLGENTYQRTSSVKHSNYVFGTNIGLKYMQNDIIAAMTVAQFDAYRDNIDKRKSIARSYDDILKTKEYAELIDRQDDDSFLMYVVKIKKDKTQSFRSFLADHGVATSHHYPSLAQHPLFEERIECNVSNSMQYELVSLPCYVDMKEEEKKYILSVINDYGCD